MSLVNLHIPRARVLIPQTEETDFLLPKPGAAPACLSNGLMGRVKEDLNAENWPTALDKVVHSAAAAAVLLSSSSSSFHSGAAADPSGERISSKLLLPSFLRFVFFVPRL